MKTTLQSVATQLKLPARLLQPQQLNIAFETTALRGLSSQQRTIVTRSLATLILQAAGVRLRKDDDVEQ